MYIYFLIGSSTYYVLWYSSQVSCNFDPSLSYLAVNYLDRLLSSQGIPVKNQNPAFLIPKNSFWWILFLLFLFSFEIQLSILSMFNHHSNQSHGSLGFLQLLVFLLQPKWRRQNSIFLIFRQVSIDNIDVYIIAPYGND